MRPANDLKMDVASFNGRPAVVGTAPNCARLPPYTPRILKWRIVVSLSVKSNVLYNTIDVNVKHTSLLFFLHKRDLYIMWSFRTSHSLILRYIQSSIIQHQKTINLDISLTNTLEIKLPWVVHSQIMILKWTSKKKQQNLQDLIKDPSFVLFFLH